MLSLDEFQALIIAAGASMIHNYPVLEAIVILPLLFRNFAWSVIGCSRAVIVTFVPQLKGDFSVNSLMDPKHLASVSFQVLVAVMFAAMVFFIKNSVVQTFWPAKSEDPAA